MFVTNLAVNVNRVNYCSGARSREGHARESGTALGFTLSVDMSLAELRQE